MEQRAANLGPSMLVAIVQGGLATTMELMSSGPSTGLVWNSTPARKPP